MSTRAIPPLVALTSEVSNNEISPSQLADVAAALQTQVVNHFAPIWHQSATVAAFPDSKAIPRGYWPIVIKGQLDEPGALGYHTDIHRQPIAYVMYDRTWPCTCSHELLEMLGDPFGSRLVTCVDPRGREHGKARVLVEVCDPPEAYTYPVNGIELSDFVEPSYYGSHHWGHGIKDTTVKASYLGTVQPLQLAKGGYLSYEGQDGRWYQSTWFGGPSPQITDISGRLDEALSQPHVRTLRQAIDSFTDSQAYIGVNPGD